MADPHHQDDQLSILQVGDDSIVAHAIAPQIALPADRSNSIFQVTPDLVGAHD